MQQETKDKIYSTRNLLCSALAFCRPAMSMQRCEVSELIDNVHSLACLVFEILESPHPVSKIQNQCMRVQDNLTPGAGIYI